MRSRWAIAAGVFDAAFASLATFGIGIFAIRYFEPAILGSYALVFAAFSLVVIIPRELVFVPAEIASVSQPRTARLSVFPTTLRLGLLPALLAAGLVACWRLAAPTGIPTHVVVALTWTAVACAFLSPIQDHLRRMLHLGGKSWLAALVSLVQIVALIAVLLCLRSIDVPAEWIPFGALAAANLLSLMVGGLLLVRQREARKPMEVSLSFRSLVEAGWWLLLGGLLAPASIFVASVLVTHLAGAEALGYAEAARVIARPLPVLAMGISFVLRPVSMEAAQKKRLVTARRTSGLYLQLLGLCGLAYLFTAGFNVAWNPLAPILPNAYVITGLAAATITGEILSVILFPYRNELLGAGRVVTLTWIEGVGAALRSLVGATAGWTLAFAMPLGHAAVVVVRLVGYRRSLQQLYVEDGAEKPASGVLSRRWQLRELTMPGSSRDS